MEIPANDWAKREALRRLIREAEPTLNNAIVFCNRKRDVDVVAKSPRQARLRRRADPWRPRPIPAHQDPGQVPRRRTQDSGRQRCGGARARRSGRQPCLQFRRADPCRRLCPSHRPHRPRRTQRRTPIMLASPRDAKYVEAIEKLTGKQAGAPRDDGHRSARGTPPAPRRGSRRTRARDRAWPRKAGIATAARRTASFTTRSRPLEPVGGPAERPRRLSPQRGRPEATAPSRTAPPREATPGTKPHHRSKPRAETAKIGAPPEPQGEQPRRWTRASCPPSCSGPCRCEARYPRTSALRLSPPPSGKAGSFRAVRDAFGLPFNAFYRTRRQTACVPPRPRLGVAGCCSHDRLRTGSCQVSASTLMGECERRPRRRTISSSSTPMPRARIPA